jgi:hypothetical protein
MSKRKPQPHRIYSSNAFWIALVVFYALSIALVWLPTVPAILIDHLEAVNWALAFCVGIAVVSITTQCNVWALFTVGFIQPFLVLVPEAIETPYILRYNFSLWPPLQVGVACAAGGWLVSLVRSGPSANDFSFAVWREWAAPSWAILSTAERVQKIFITISGLATFIAMILKYL